MKSKVLITGGNGRIGKLLIPLLQDKYQITIFESNKKRKNENKNFFYGDIRNIEDLESALADVDILIHLAGIPDEDSFLEKLMPINIEGTYKVFEAAKNCGVKKIIFASTIQTVWNYPNSIKITTNMPPRPFNLYACTKIFGETLGRYYSDKFGISVICLRIGYFLNYDHELLSDSEKSKMWCSPNDLCQIIEKSIKTECKYEIFFALSNNKNSNYDISNVIEKIDYKPIDGTENKKKIQTAIHEDCIL
jgi:uronate dehydrogenase